MYILTCIFLDFSVGLMEVKLLRWCVVGMGGSMRFLNPHQLRYKACNSGEIYPVILQSMEKYHERRHWKTIKIMRPLGVQLGI